MRGRHLSDAFSTSQAVDEGLERLGKQRLVLAIHDVSFPSAPGEDLGRGSAYTKGGHAFARFARSLGFNGIQLGPQGITPRDNPSPYDGTLFSKNPLSIDLFGLLDGRSDEPWAGLLSPAQLDAARDAFRLGVPPAEPNRAAHVFSYDAYRALLDQACLRLLNWRSTRARQAAQIESRLSDFEAEHEWLEADALYAAISGRFGGKHPRDWPASAAREASLYHSEGPAARAARAAARSRHHRAVLGYRLEQTVAHHQHDEMREALRRSGLSLYGDLQVGMSPADAFSRSRYFLSHYYMGAPPSRTNPDGQPWGYPVLDPAQLVEGRGHPAQALDFVRRRVGKMLDEFDSLRIDHPHGLVCPWVYRADADDPLAAVQQGARLYASPALPDHPGLQPYAIADEDQLDHEVARHADGWVRTLRPDQVERYARVVDAIVDAALERSRARADVLCEVLSTMPYPLGRVLERHGLGRFRVTQKAKLDRDDDVYRSENARPEDWVMVGNHDTPPLWAVVERWRREGSVAQQAAYLATRLRPAPRFLARDRERLTQDLAEDPNKLVHAKVADLFVCPARSIMVFFADLFGLEAIYNRPGEVHPDNWRLRVPHDYADRYPRERAEGRALNLDLCIALALHGRGEPTSLAQRLAASAPWWPDALEG